MTQHAGLTEERWSGFDLDRQILMIGNEMNRIRTIPADDSDARLRGYERVLRLTDLTLATTDRRGLLRELTRWRDLIAMLYLDPSLDLSRHDVAFRALLLLRPASASQIRFLLG